MCPKHGRQGIALVCPHAAQAFDKKLPIPPLIKATAVSDGFDFEIKLCANCAAVANADNRGLSRTGAD
jgi:hypothetical protein